VLGLCGGLLLGGVGMLVSGLRARFSGLDCAGLSGPECELLRQTSLEVSRFQTLAGGALIALAAALVVLVRPRSPPPGDTGPA
jgi:hypothetical protein